MDTCKLIEMYAEILSNKENLHVELVEKVIERLDDDIINISWDIDTLRKLRNRAEEIHSSLQAEDDK